MAEEKQQAENNEAGAQNLAIQKIYTKDISFESPNSPYGFQDEWKPEISVDLNTDGQTLENNNFEVVLKITVTAKNNDKTAFLVEVQQAGIFNISGFAEEQQAFILGSYCPGTLFPYAREVISSLVTDGGYPPVILAPVNFDALFQEHLNQKESAPPSTQAESEKTH